MSEEIIVTESMRFEEPIHMTNFLNYLYRTDRAQKWTNAATVGNKEFHADGAAWLFPADYEERRQYKLEAHRAIARAVDAGNVNKIKVAPFENFIIYPPVDMDLARVAGSVFAAASKQDRWIVDLVVSHVDQSNGPHVHVVGRLEKGLRRKQGESLPHALFAL